MSKDIDAIQFRNDDGEYVYAKSHLDAIDGMEEYTEGLTWSIQFMGDYIFDTGWKPYDHNAGNGVEINTNYKSDGFECGIREIILNPTAFGNGNQTRMKMIRVNVRNFVNNMQIFQLPSGFVAHRTRFQIAGDINKLPYTLIIEPSGKTMVYVHNNDSNTPSTSNWIYGQYTWIE
ncbi:hypothetical protein [Staphylococcus pseudoxylosus]|uniref:hypothetical protein n=1 Tax=Staphylococcus pseudoxylosus TaxID=2282419 RepID=UPI00301AE531